MPSRVSENLELGFGPEVMAKIIKATGIERRPVTDRHTVADLGEVAANRLLNELNWERDTVDLIIVVTQTPDYPLPSTACLLQHRLGLKAHVAAFDLSLGCSGYVYGLSVITAMMASGAFRRALLIAGDITSKMISDKNQALAPLFGDAVSVTALESNGAKISFDLGSDGSGAPYLMSKTGGVAEPGEPQLFMDGTQVMAFSLKRVAQSVSLALTAAGLDIEQIDHVVLHQANALMLKTLGHKIKARDDQIVIAVRDYGNTSSASIPLALCDHLPKTPDKPSLDLVLCGFGVGWSWSTAIWSTPRPLIVGIERVP
jgi:3-oxoacyl-[acyl-carrier-protein] synthase III